MNWRDEQEEYRLSKQDSTEAAAFIFAGIVIATLIALGVEIWQRIFG